MSELKFECVLPDGTILPSGQDPEAHEIRVRVQHLGCGGTLSRDPITGSELTCRQCGGKWRETYGAAGLVRLPLYGGYFPVQ